MGNETRRLRIRRSFEREEVRRDDQIADGTGHGSNGLFSGTYGKQVQRHWRQVSMIFLGLGGSGGCADSPLAKATLVQHLFHIMKSKAPPNRAWEEPNFQERVQQLTSFSMRLTF